MPRFSELRRGPLSKRATFSDGIAHAADHSGRAVEGMNCLRSLELWDRGFESIPLNAWMFVCVCAYSVFVR
jgi:hypothetical protein